MEPIEFHGMLKEVRSYRMAGGDLEAKATIAFRPLDKGNELAIAKLSKIQELEQEIKVSVILNEI